MTKPTPLNEILNYEMLETSLTETVAKMIILGAAQPKETAARILTYLSMYEQTFVPPKQ